MKAKYITKAIMVLGVIGLVDSLYLSYARYTSTDIACNILEGCNVVAASSYSVLLGMPLAYLGVLFYLGVLVLGFMLLLRVKIKNLEEALLWVTVFGALDSLYFLYVQGVLIKAFCIYCILSAVVTFCLVGAAYLLHKLSHLEQAVASEFE